VLVGEVNDNFLVIFLWTSSNGFSFLLRSKQIISVTDALSSLGVEVEDGDGVQTSLLKEGDTLMEREGEYDPELMELSQWRLVMIFKSLIFIGGGMSDPSEPPAMLSKDLLCVDIILPH
jgi:hypothetical protein